MYKLILISVAVFIAMPLRQANAEDPIILSDEAYACKTFQDVSDYWRLVRENDQRAALLQSTQKIMGGACDHFPAGTNIIVSERAEGRMGISRVHRVGSPTFVYVSNLHLR